MDITEALLDAGIVMISLLVAVFLVVGMVLVCRHIVLRERGHAEISSQQTELVRTPDGRAEESGAA